MKEVFTEFLYLVKTGHGSNPKPFSQADKRFSNYRGQDRRPDPQEERRNARLGWTSRQVPGELDSRSRGYGWTRPPTSRPWGFSVPLPPPPPAYITSKSWADSSPNCRRHEAPRPWIRNRSDFNERHDGHRDHFHAQRNRPPPHLFKHRFQEGYRHAPHATRSRHESPDTTRSVQPCPPQDADAYGTDSTDEDQKGSDRAVQRCASSTPNDAYTGKGKEQEACSPYCVLKNLSVSPIHCRGRTPRLDLSGPGGLVQFSSPIVYSLREIHKFFQRLEQEEIVQMLKECDLRHEQQMEFNISLLEEQSSEDKSANGAGDVLESSDSDTEVVLYWNLDSDLPEIDPHLPENSSEYFPKHGYQYMPDYCIGPICDEGMYTDRERLQMQFELWSIGSNEVCGNVAEDNAWFDVEEYLEKKRLNYSSEDWWHIL